MADPRYTQAFGGAPAAAQTAASAAVNPYARPLSTGDMLLGRYRIMGSCGTGGFGTVLACWDTRLQRRVAIKRMQLVSAEGAAPSAATLAEGLAEARASSTLTHPNIVTVFDFEADESFAYLVMEYVDGITLTELLNRVEGGTLTGDEVAYLVQAVAGALSFAHRSGVLHLDIKPSNIMIDREGAIKLCDFGMATLASAAGYGDARGGTVGYMPPEQILGELVDERADVFSLAVVAWQALAGRGPVGGPRPLPHLAHALRRGAGKRGLLLAGRCGGWTAVRLPPALADRGDRGAGAGKGGRGPAHLLPLSLDRGPHRPRHGGCLRRRPREQHPARLSER